MQRRRRLAAGATAVLIGLSAVTACASKDSEGSSGTNDEKAQVVDVTIKDGTVDPNGKRIEVDLNQKITVNIDADEAGELHVHSKPEQEIAYPEGTSSNELSFDKPGVFAVESHDLGITLIEFKVD